MQLDPPAVAPGGHTNQGFTSNLAVKMNAETLVICELALSEQSECFQFGQGVVQSFGFLGKAKAHHVLVKAISVKR